MCVYPIDLVESHYNWVLSQMFVGGVKRYPDNYRKRFYFSNRITLRHQSGRRVGDDIISCLISRYKKVIALPLITCHSFVCPESIYCFVRLLSSGRLNCEEWNEGYLPDEYIF